MTNKVTTIINHFLLGLATLAILGNQTTKPTFAVESAPIDLAVGPPTTYLQIKPGATVSQRLTIEQKGRLPLEITPSLVDFISDGKTGQPVLQDNSTFRYASLKLPADGTVDDGKNSFSLNPRQKKNISVTFTIPKDATEGEFPLSVLFRAKPSTDTVIGVGESEVSAIVGSNIIVVISKSAEDKSSISLEKIESIKLIDSLMPLSFTVLAKNTGKNASTASGSATITDWQNHQLATFPIFPDMILAGSTRQLRTTPSLTEASENPGLVTPVFSYRTLFLLGPYTISAQLESANTTQINESQLTQTVIAFPFSFIAIGLLCFGAWRFFLLLNTKKTSPDVPAEK